MRNHRFALRALCVAAVLAARAAPAQDVGIDLSEIEKKKSGKNGEKPAQKPKEAPPREQRPPPRAKPSGPTVLPGLDVGANTAAAQERLAGAKKLFEQRSYETAALAYHAILEDPSLAPAHDEARYQLAKSLARMGLHHSALARFDEILARGPQGTKYFHSSLEWIFYLSKRMVNEAPVIARVARVSGEAFPPAYEDRFRYLLAKYNYERGRALAEAGQGGEAARSYDEARRLAAAVGPGGRAQSGPEGTADVPEGNLQAKARFIDGLALYAQGKKPEALDSFKEVVRLTNPKRTRRPDPKLREMAFLQLARIHYEHRQNRYAIFYYSKMPWGEESWLEGLWESSYAHYRIGDYEKALGNLITLHSPYFADEYFPESHLLKAIIYFENCRYPEARSILEDFARLYEPVHQDLERLTAANGSPAAFYELIDQAQDRRGEGRRPGMGRVLKVAFTDRNVKRLAASISEMERELDRGIGGRRDAFRRSPLAQELTSALDASKRRLVDEAGARARAKLEYERDGLKDLLQQALRIKIEVSRKERELLEGQLAGGKGPAMQRYRHSTAVSDEHQYWPYEGEFWRDELGTYSYTLTRGCQERAAARTRVTER